MPEFAPVEISYSAAEARMFSSFLVALLPVEISYSNM